MRLSDYRGYRRTPIVSGKRCIVCVVGTRPEAIKMAPVIEALNQSGWAKVRLVTTGQHDELLSSTLADFALDPDFSLRHRKRGHSPALLLSHLVPRLEKILKDTNPDLVVAQGDTTTAFATSLAAFYSKIPFVHVEAGLRTDDLEAPFPEEFHRRSIAVSTALHCAPTSAAAENLLRENIPQANIVITGNSVIDAALSVAASKPDLPPGYPAQPTILLTAHRRENFGEPLRDAFAAIKAFLNLRPNVEVYFPVHPNPNAREVAHAELGGHPRVKLVAPLNYHHMIAAIANAWCVVTDSGGLQEEAPALGKPVLVLRDTTERPEAIASGVVELIGTSREGVFTGLDTLYRNPAKYRRMARPVFPYGDGHAGTRIAAAMQRYIAAHGRKSQAKIIRLPQAS